MALSVLALVAVLRLLVSGCVCCVGVNCVCCRFVVCVLLLGLLLVCCLLLLWLLIVLVVVFLWFDLVWCDFAYVA